MAVYFGIVVFKIQTIRHTIDYLSSAKLTFHHLEPRTYTVMYNFYDYIYFQGNSDN